jgi:hypothetical protein
MHSLKRLRLMRFMKLLPPLALVAVLVACGKEPASAGGSDGTGIHTNPFRFGDAVGTDGIVVRETSVIPPGSLAAMSFNVRNAPAGTQVRIIWKDIAKNADTGEQVKQIGSKGFVAFQQTSPLPEGSYRVDMFYKPPGAKEWQNLGSHTFRVGR